ncbi:DNA primase [Mannheimia haemolytica]
MKGTIPRSFIDDLIARTDIVEVINSRVKLKKAGRDYQACCPFITRKPLPFR